MEQIRKQIDAPGSYWDGRQTTDERTTKYKCRIRDSTLHRKFPSKPAPESAFQLQEMYKNKCASTERKTNVSI